MPFITKLGDAGMIWILLSVVLLFIPRTRKSGAITDGQTWKPAY